ncbi:flagellar biosynthesis protein FlgA [Nocardia higoensis]|uniref:Flagellar biosynthesis protein FlgA n=1 Tax=Nocardia higoensis TaxID=228599 RepID=A0ABS0DAK5_9NOCA|nr:SAF domain-containing protein [Nocardia higoensis]MBF6355495.1 flagellar biosynthesis protein FlgA [Nocardia higoensis]
MPRLFSDLGRDSVLRTLWWNRPPWIDAALARRVLAAALVVAAALLLVRGDPDAKRVSVVLASRDLPPGASLTAADVTTAPREAGSLPTGAVRDPGDLLGATLTGAMRTGEVFTDLRVVGPRLAEVATGAAESRIVPIRLADTAVAGILRAGDRVDVVGAEERARTLAKDAAVVLVAESGERDRAGPVVLVAMDAEHAVAVAAASLHTALTVVLH